MKLVFAGAPEFSVLPLKKILEEGYEVAAVVTQPDKPVGRKAIVTPTPLKVFARSRGIPVLDFPKIREHIGELESLRAHLMVTCAYGQLLTESVLNAFPAGVYNIHASLLPKYRGASPVAACILNGETETGITVMKTDVGLDTGICCCKRVSRLPPRIRQARCPKNFPRSARTASSRRSLF